jgi:hypothetical protein
MVYRAIEDILALNGQASASRWVALIRSAPQTKKLKELSDDELGSIYDEMSHELSRWIAGTSDKNDLGYFFAQIGKEYSVNGIPLTELSMALTLARKATVKRIADEGAFESSNALYAMLDVSERIADFYSLGNYYLTKGFLETTIERITATKAVSKATLVDFFRDDLFYRG